MKNKNLLLTLGLLVIAVTTVAVSVIDKTVQRPTTQPLINKDSILADPILHPKREVHLKNSGDFVKVLIESRPVKEPVFGITEVFVGKEKNPQLSLSGYLLNAHSLDLSKDNREELEIEVSTGQLIYTTLYRYQDGLLKPLPIYQENLKGSTGVYSYHFPKFIENQNGTLTMLVYHTDSPVGEAGIVEVYNYDGQKLTKINEYKSTTDEFYL